MTKFFPFKENSFCNRACLGKQTRIHRTCLFVATQLQNLSGIHVYTCTSLYKQGQCLFPETNAPQRGLSLWSECAAFGRKSLLQSRPNSLLCGQGVSLTVQRLKSEAVNWSLGKVMDSICFPILMLLGHLTVRQAPPTAPFWHRINMQVTIFCFQFGLP